MTTFIGSRNLPIIVVNLNDKRSMDQKLCPPLLRDKYAVHVPFKMKIIQHALDHFPDEYAKHDPADAGPRHYPEGTYKNLGL